MAEHLIIRPEAEADLTDAFNWHEKQLEGLGSDFLNSVEAALFAIKRNPVYSPANPAATDPSISLRHFLYSEWINDSGHCGLSRTPESRQLEETLMNVYNYTRFQSLELRVCFSGC